MTPSASKIYLALALLLATAQVAAADPPTAEIAEARARLAQAKALTADRDYRDARTVAETAAAVADLARAEATLAALRVEVDEKAARNDELRRRLFVRQEN